jgi:hypothetical protein
MDKSHFIRNESSSSFLNTKRKKRILLGITGSVAAIKGPELALKLSKELDAHVAILLTRGGENFWSKAKDYNLQKWIEFHDFVASDTSKSKKGDNHSQAVPSLPQDDDPRSIVMFCKFFSWLLDDFIVGTLKPVKFICDDRKHLLTLTHS